MLVVAAVAAGGADAGYLVDIQRWQRDFDADLRSAGWLALAGRFKLAEGVSTLGSDSSCTVTLPASAPGMLGTLTRQAGMFKFEPARGVQATVDGKAVTAVTELSTSNGSGRIRLGALLMDVRAVGEDFYLLVQDFQNPAIASFKGTSWFPIDAAYRVSATFNAYERPQRVLIAMTHVDSKETMTSTGDLIFQLRGKTIRLKSFVDDNQLFVMFQDPTNGKQTYGGGRFLYAAMPRDGLTVLDFNKAFNPYCSVNSYVMCPIPPRENRIDARIAAGERYDAGRE
jgi:uncharacterized protein (DUF1684 family)